MMSAKDVNVFSLIFKLLLIFKIGVQKRVLYHDYKNLKGASKFGN